MNKAFDFYSNEIFVGDTVVYHSWLNENLLETSVYQILEDNEITVVLIHDKLYDVIDAAQCIKRVELPYNG